MKCGISLSTGREEDPSAEDLEELENPSAEELPVWEIDDPAAQRAAAVKRDQQNADALVDIAQVYPIKCHRPLFTLAHCFLYKHVVHSLKG